MSASSDGTVSGSGFVFTQVDIHREQLDVSNSPPIPRRPALPSAPSAMNPSNNDPHGGNNLPPSGFFSGFPTAPLLSSAGHPSNASGGTPATPSMSVPSPAASALPSYDELLSVDPAEQPSRYSGAPWFHPTLVQNEDLIEQYADGSGLLPGDLHVWMTLSFDWRNRVAVPTHVLVHRRGESGAQARIAMIQLAYQRLYRTPSEFPVPEEYQFDIAFYPTQGEMGYGDRLAALAPSIPERGPSASVHQNYLCWARPILRAEFRYLRHNPRSNFLQMIRFERRSRSRFGYMIPYQNVEAERIRPQYMRGRYVPLPRMWAAHEACRGCYIELPPCITYISSRLCSNPFSGWWSVVLTEWVAREAAYLVFEVYDQFRLWYLPPRVRSGIRSLDLSLVLGGAGNYNEAISLLDAMDQVDWNSVPIQWSRRHQGTNPADRSPGRRTPLAGDYVYYDPVERRFISEPEALALRDRERVVPPGHPTGYIVNDGYFQPYEEADPMMDNDPPATGVGANGGSGFPSAEGFRVPAYSTPGPSVAPLAGPSQVPSWNIPHVGGGPFHTAPVGSGTPSASVTSQDRAAIIAQFLGELGMDTSGASGDIAQMRAAMLALLAQPGHPHQSGGPSS